MGAIGEWPANEEPSEHSLRTGVFQLYKCERVASGWQVAGSRHSFIRGLTLCGELEPYERIESAGGQKRRLQAWPSTHA